MTNRKKLKLLIVDTPDNRIEELLAILHGQGMANSSRRISERQELGALVTEGKWDMVLVNDESHDLQADDCLDVIRRAGGDLPLLVVTQNRLNIDQLEACILAGAEGLISTDMPEYSTTVVMRVWDALRQRRLVRQLESASSELRDRCQTLLRDSSDAVAYIHDGMHVYGNRHYLDLFGFEDEDTLYSMPFIDMVGEQDRVEVRALISGLPTDEVRETQEAERPVAFVNGEGQLFHARLKFGPAQYEGEQCLQLLLLPVEVDVRDEETDDSSIPEVEPLPEEPSTPPGTVTPAVAEQQEGGQSRVAEADPEPAHEPQEPVQSLPEPSALGLFHLPVVAVADIETECFDILFGAGQQDTQPGDYLGITRAIARHKEGDRYDLWALGQVLELQSELYKRGQALQFLMAFGRASLQLPRLGEQILEQFRARGLDAGALILRLRREDVESLPEEAGKLLESMRESGARCCIDDYVPGERVDEFLKRHRVQFCRLDGERISGGKLEGQALGEIVEAMHEKRIRVIATGVTSTERLGVYWKSDIDLVQGEYFQQAPVPLDVDTFSDQLEVLRNAV